MKKLFAAFAIAGALAAPGGAFAEEVGAAVDASVAVASQSDAANTGSSIFSGAARGLPSAAGGIAGCAVAGVAIGAGPGAVAAATGIPVSDTLTHIYTGGSLAKECILDGLVVGIREALIASLTDSTINWINNGFEGGPAFVTDLDAFLGDVADQVSIGFILGDELGFLCSPFQLQVRLALELQQRPFRQYIQCSLGEVSDNIEGFLQGNFSKGGFPALFRLSTNFNNNPYGAYITARSELQGRRAAAVNRELTKLGWSGGFLSSESCDGGVAAEGNTLSSRAACLAAGGRWTVKTPGTVINDQLQHTLGSGQRQLELADEIDEIISALLAQLAQKALTSVNGLRGLSSRSSSSATVEGSYLERLTETTQTHAVASARVLLIMTVASAVALEDQYQSALQDELAILDAQAGILAGRRQCFAALSGADAAHSAAVASSTLAAVVEKRERFDRALTISGGAEQALIQMEFDVDAALTTAAVNAVGERYDALAGSGALQTSASFTLLLDIRNADRAGLEGMKQETGQCMNQDS